jgi:cardiolipin synthase
MNSRSGADVFADRALSRVAGAPLIDGNHVRLLKDGAENYPAWLEAINSARQHVHFETFIFHHDELGQRFADALVAKVREGVRVRVIYDWMGCLRTRRRFWNHLREGGVEVRAYNPPRFDSPLGWLSRDHRKTIAIDGRLGFISGLCIGIGWMGDPEKGIEPWRDTGVELRGPAVADVEHAFADIWAMLGTPIPASELQGVQEPEIAGDMSVRIVASLPSTAGIFRTDQFIAAQARKRLWLSDAYYAGTTSYVQALRAAASDNVDVRLLVPNSTDLPFLRPLSRAGYRALLEGGVRIFEWNGSMMHAKTAVADGRWARVGSTNLNVVSWFGNCELDAIVENEAFGREMEKMYLQDLENSTEVVLDPRHRVRLPGQPRRRGRRSKTGSARRAAAGAVRIGNAIGAALTNRRVIEPLEGRIMVTAAVLLITFAVIAGLFPWLLAGPLIVAAVWGGLALFFKGWKLHRQRKR